MTLRGSHTKQLVLEFKPVQVSPLPLARHPSNTTYLPTLLLTSGFQEFRPLDV